MHRLFMLTKNTAKAAIAPLRYVFSYSQSL